MNQKPRKLHRAGAQELTVTNDFASSSRVAVATPPVAHRKPIQQENSTSSCDSSPEVSRITRSNSAPLSGADQPEKYFSVEELYFQKIRKEEKKVERLKKTTSETAQEFLTVLKNGKPLKRYRYQ